MKILRLGKNGMVRSQSGTWYNANHFFRFFMLSSGAKDWEINGETSSQDYVILGKFKSFEEAQAELDSLFGEDEIRS